MPSVITVGCELGVVFQQPASAITVIGRVKWRGKRLVPVVRLIQIQHLSTIVMGISKELTIK
jgi:hypothetical protein